MFTINPTSAIKQYLVADAFEILKSRQSGSTFAKIFFDLGVAAIRRGNQVAFDLFDIIANYPTEMKNLNRRMVLAIKCSYQVEPQKLRKNPVSRFLT